jgi:hypothetical protein
MHGLVPKAVFDVDIVSEEMESPSMAPSGPIFEAKAPTTGASTPSGCHIIAHGGILGILLVVGVALLTI